MEREERLAAHTKDAPSALLPTPRRPLFQVQRLRCSGCPPALHSSEVWRKPGKHGGASQLLPRILGGTVGLLGCLLGWDGVPVAPEAPKSQGPAARERTRAALPSRAPWPRLVLGEGPAEQADREGAGCASGVHVWLLCWPPQQHLGAWGPTQAWGLASVVGSAGNLASQPASFSTFESWPHDATLCAPAGSCFVATPTSSPSLPGPGVPS